MIFIYEWNSKKLIRIVLTLELAIIGLIGFFNLGFAIPIIRQLLGFIFLTFVPGILILRVLNLKNLGVVETILFSTGLSLSFIMILGFSINILYPLVGISNPISTLPLIVTLFLLVLTLCIILYKREFHDEMIITRSSTFQLSSLLNPPTLYLIFIPLISILGTYLVNFYENNILILILIPIIALIPIVIVFTNDIPSYLYPLAIWSIAISLLWHWSLISIGLTGVDIHHEYYFQNMVLLNSYWDSTILSNVNSMLSITMLVPIYSLVLNLESVWIFKIIFPIFFSLVPLTLFEIYQKQMEDKVAFVSSFFFMSFSLFFSEMTQLARQEVAELFLSLLILLLLNKEIDGYKRSLISIIFGFSIAVSHYGLSYIYIIFLLIILLIHILQIMSKSNYLLYYIRKFSKLSTKSIERPLQTLVYNISIRSKYNFNFILVFIIFCLSWYLYIGSESIFHSATRIFEHMFKSFYADFFNVEARDPMIAQALGLSPMRGNEIEWNIARIFQQITQVCILCGIISLAFIRYGKKFYRDFVFLGFAGIIVLLMSIIFPYFSSSLNMGRIYHITLLFLAPFCILGGKFIFHLFFQVIRKLEFHFPHVDTTKLVTLLIIIPYFLFTTGFVFYITDSTQSSMPLTLYNDDWLFPTYAEACSSKWLENYIAPSNQISVDEYGRTLLRFQGMISGSMMSSLSLSKLSTSPENNNKTSYIFLRRWNVLHHQARLITVKYATPMISYIDLENSTYSIYLSNRNKLYDNGITRILGPV